MKKYFVIALLAFAPQFALAGSQSYTSAGAYLFTVPANTTLTVQVWGAGGGGGMDGGGGGGAYKSATFQSSQLPSEIMVTVGAGGSQSRNNGYPGVCGGAGGNSAFGNYVVAFGGGGGGLGAGGGGGGQASAGQTISCAQAVPNGGNGGAPGGGAGGVYSQNVDTPAAGDSTYGGGGGSSQYTTSDYGTVEGVGGNSVYGGGGGGGGGSPEYGTVRAFGTGGNSTYGGGGGSSDETIAHGSGSSYGAGGDGSAQVGPSSDVGGYTFGIQPWVGVPQNGSDGAVLISWTATAQPSCSVSFNPNPMTGDSSAMSWTSQNIPSGGYLVINQVGPVAAAGQTQVYSTGDYTGTIYAADGTTALASCPATLSDAGSNTGDNGSNGNTSGDNTSNGNVNSCPAGQSFQNGSCVTASCGEGYVCQDGNLYWRDASCNIDAANEKSCQYGCAAGGTSCSAPPSPEIASWQVSPILVRKGETTAITWQSHNVQSCVVSGSNLDGTAQSTDSNSPGVWSATSGSEISSPIVGQTVYTITCEGYPGASPASASASSTVNLVPTYNEH